MKYIFIVPGAYLLLFILAGVFFLRGAGGHGSNPFDFVIYLDLPACYLLNIFPAPHGPEAGLVAALVCGFAGLVQWTLIGLLCDKILAWRRRKKLLHETNQS
jgi:hypothetical protein